MGEAGYLAFSECSSYCLSDRINLSYLGVAGSILNVKV